MSGEPRWTRRPDGSTWGDFGDGQLGRLGLLTPDRVRAGIAEAREGLTFCLSLPLDFPGGSVLNPRRFPPDVHPVVRDGVERENYPMRELDPESTDVLNDDSVLLYLQYSTHWDSLAHVGQYYDIDGDGEDEVVFYDGYGPGDVGQGGMGPLGIDRMATGCVQGRGVLVDLAAHFRYQRALVGYDELMWVLEVDDVVVEPGDILCLHTGFAQMILDFDREPDGRVLDESCAVLDGRDQHLLQWIADAGIVAIASDNFAVEGFPARPMSGPRSSLPLHEHCLFRLGLHLGELWYLTELAAWLREHQRSRFLLTAPPLRLPGAAGSPVTPVATV
jgi:kynurenine formamidase